MSKTEPEPWTEPNTDTLKRSELAAMLIEVSKKLNWGPPSAYSMLAQLLLEKKS